MLQGIFGSTSLQRGRGVKRVFLVSQDYPKQVSPLPQGSPLLLPCLTAELIPGDIVSLQKDYKEHDLKPCLECCF